MTKALVNIVRCSRQTLTNACPSVEFFGRQFFFQSVDNEYIAGESHFLIRGRQAVFAPP